MSVLLDNLPIFKLAINKHINILPHWAIGLYSSLTSHPFPSILFQLALIMVLKINLPPSCGQSREAVTFDHQNNSLPQDAPQISSFQQKWATEKPPRIMALQSSKDCMALLSGTGLRNRTIQAYSQGRRVHVLGLHENSLQFYSFKYCVEVHGI